MLHWLHKQLVLVAHGYEGSPDWKSPARGQCFWCPVRLAGVDAVTTVDIEILADYRHMLN